MKKLLTLCAYGASVFALAAPAQAITVYGLTSDNSLVSFSSSSPGTVTSLGTISQPGIIDLDFSPSNGQLYGMTSDGLMYFINTSNAAASLAVTPLTALSGILDFDFNPAADRVRLFGAGDQNFRLIPDASAITAPQTGTPGTVIADGTFSNTSFELVANAYTNNFNNASGGTTLYSIDTTTDALVIHSTVTPPDPAGSFNTVTSVGGLNVTVGSDVGFDVGQDGVAYVSAGSAFYTVDLGTGAATSAGTVGISGLTSIATAVPEPGTALLVASGLAGVALRRRRSVS